MRMTTRRRLRLGVAFAIASAGVLALPAIAGAQASPIKHVTLKPGGTISLSGTDCIINDAPGVVGVLVVALNDEGKAVPGTEWGYPDEVTPKSDGSWTFSGPLPPHVDHGEWIAVGICIDPADPGNQKKWKSGPENAVQITIETPTPPGGEEETPPPPPNPGDLLDLRKKLPSKPKVLKTKPAFTG